MKLLKLSTIDDIASIENIGRWTGGNTFETLCPNYTSKPHAAVESLSQSQTTVNEDGNTMIVPVAQFHLFYVHLNHLYV